MEAEDEADEAKGAAKGDAKDDAKDTLAELESEIIQRHASPLVSPIGLPPMGSLEQDLLHLINI
jgi:hypothetical protein